MPHISTFKTLTPTGINLSDDDHWYLRDWLLIVDDFVFPLKHIYSNNFGTINGVEIVIETFNEDDVAFLREWRDEALRISRSWSSSRYKRVAQKHDVFFEGVWPKSLVIELDKHSTLTYTRALLSVDRIRMII